MKSREDSHKALDDLFAELRQLAPSVEFTIHKYNKEAALNPDTDQRDYVYSVVVTITLDYLLTANTTITEVDSKGVLRFLSFYGIRKPLPYKTKKETRSQLDAVIDYLQQLWVKQYNSDPPPEEEIDDAMYEEEKYNRMR